jgi:hypothetical protein
MEIFEESQPPYYRLVALIASIAISSSALSLREIAAQLKGMRERMPPNGQTWIASSTKFQPDRARQTGLVIP